MAQIWSLIELTSHASDVRQYRTVQGQLRLNEVTSAKILLSVEGVCVVTTILLAHVFDL